MNMALHLKSELQIDKLLSDPNADLELLIVSIRDYFGAAHVVYHGARVGAKAVDDPFIRLTYPAEWVRRYLVQSYIVVDPVLREGFLRAAPFDWAEITPTTDAEIAFFQDAQAYNIGSSGLSIPVRDKSGRRALFTISSHLTGAEWELFKRLYQDQLINIAHIVHQRALEFQFAEAPRENLSARETEVLYWSSQGKTAGDIAIILSLGETTIRTYIKSAKHKLGCISLTQAVSKAITHGIIGEIDPDAL
ncbi:MAG: LuxR family transcriptional regulator [Pseudomonadota bacterium]